MLRLSRRRFEELVVLIHRLSDGNRRMSHASTLAGSSGRYGGTAEKNSGDGTDKV